MPRLLEDLAARTQEFCRTTSKKEREDISQVFTPPVVARFMAERLSRIPREFRFIDAGAGAGILAAAVCERIAKLRSPRTVHADLFETDPKVIVLLREAMGRCQRLLMDRGHRFSFFVRDSDFILQRPVASLFSTRADDGIADAVIMNPPYAKLSKDSPHARAFSEIVHGQPNVYALFMATAVEMLRPAGELVAITPRSFCNGPYFRGFRRWLFDRMAIRHMHVFESRRDVFREAEVLQESVITAATKQPRKFPVMTISSSSGQAFIKTKRHSFATSHVIDNSSGDSVIRLPCAAGDSAIIHAVESWSQTFAERGLRISTGPVVTFRAMEFLLDSPNGPDAVPLLSIHNVKPFEIIWPLPKGSKPVAFRNCEAGGPLLRMAQNYVLLRRFSAKEQERRLTAAAYLPTSEQRRNPVAIENHLNYITHRDRELSPFEAHGLVALLNSWLLDRFFRTFSGHTQVNATEIRSMPFPDLMTLARIGRRVASSPVPESNAIDELVLDELGFRDLASSLDRECVA